MNKHETRRNCNQFVRVKYNRLKNKYTYSYSHKVRLTFSKLHDL